MTEIPFSKYHGAGNDFILINNMEGKFSFTNTQINKLCNRHLGIGADGLILLSKDAECDFAMQYFNSDGLEGSMCGNGGRAAAAFAFDEEIAGEKSCFRAFDGRHHAAISQRTDGKFEVSLTMNDVEQIIHGEKYLMLNTGSPHYVVECDNLSAIDIMKEGAKVRYDKTISENGVNVNFIQRSYNKIYVRTYERGVEAETLSCGTGVTAVAIASDIWYGVQKHEIIAQGGTFVVEFTKEGRAYRKIVLHGPVQFVFKGKFFI